MGCLWDRLFPILRGHDDKQVVERVAAAEFPLMKRNMIVDFSLPSSPSGSSYADVHLEKTERGNDTRIVHVKYANFPSGHKRIESLWMELEHFGYGVHKATIYHPGQQNLMFGGTREGINTQIVLEALDRHSALIMHLSITGDRTGFILNSMLLMMGLSILRADVSDAHEITFYVVDRGYSTDHGDSRLLEDVLPHPILKDRDLCISYPNINLWTHR